MSNRTMLINGRHAEQLRVAVVERGVLQLYDVEGTEATLKRGNIYRGVVANIERSLNAAFVEFGDAKHGFLTRHDVIPQAFHRAAGDAQHAPIDQILQKVFPRRAGHADAEGGKGATLTTNVSLAGRFLVYFPYDPQRGVSRKVEDEALRRKLREKAKDLDLDEDEGVIVRTNAADQTKADPADLLALKRLWKAVVDDMAQGRGAKILYDDQDLLIHSLRDNLDTQIDEVLIDDEQLLAKAEKYVQAVMPRAKVGSSLRRTAPLLHYNVEPRSPRSARTVGRQRRRHRHRPRRGADRDRRQLREVESREEPGRHRQPHQPRSRGRGRQAAAAARHRRAGGRGLHRHALPGAPARGGEGPARGDEAGPRPPRDRPHRRKRPGGDQPPAHQERPALRTPDPPARVGRSSAPSCRA
jgi:hypothetical protein